MAGYYLALPGLNGGYKVERISFFVSGEDLILARELNTTGGFPLWGFARD